MAPDYLGFGLSERPDGYGYTIAEHAGVVGALVDHDDDGPWAGFARQTVEDWLAILASAQPARRRRSKAGSTERTLALAVLRGALLDLLATGDVERTTAALDAHLRLLVAPSTRARAGSPQAVRATLRLVASTELSSGDW